MANKVSLNPKPPFDFIVFPLFMKKIILIKREKKITHFRFFCLISPTAKQSLTISPNNFRRENLFLWVSTSKKDLKLDKSTFKSKTLKNFQRMPHTKALKLQENFA